ncbi:calpain-5-like [Paramormyrops kingsleyae]|uniref:calpain-5-like n=1 Tax=Paramormyrops kingsleyae TaxID=1676925 RepID=UPI003B975200
MSTAREMSQSITLYKNQDYSELKAACLNDGKLFEDPEFPAEDSSLFFKKSPPGTVKWLRPREICDEPRLFVDGISSHDLNQGAVGNCWFVAACSCLALKPDLWDKVIPDWKEQDWDISPDKDAGIFHFRFWIFGEWLDVVVDDRLPTVNGELIYCHSKSKREFWSALLEKAYAKLFLCYECLDGGLTGDALVDFTGCVTEYVDLVEGNYASDESMRSRLFETLSIVFDRNGIITCSVKASPTEMEHKMECGLVKGHAYAVTSIKKMRVGQNKNFMIRMQNPWGMVEWNGPWSDRSEEWKKLTFMERESIGLIVDDDGEFWMTFEDWCHYFTNAEVCHLINTSPGSQEKTWKQAVTFRSWTQHDDPLLNRCGGSPNYQQSFLQNPQYMFDLLKDDEEVLVSLQQRDMRLLKPVGEGENLTIGFVILEVELNRKYRLHDIKTQKIVAKSVYMNARTVFLRKVLPRGRYIIIPTTLTPGVLGDFMLRIFSDVDCACRVLMEDKPQVKCWSGFLGYPQVVTHIHIEGVEGLENHDSSQGIDPYLIIHCEGRTIQSRVIKDTMDPVFNISAIFYRKKPSKPIVIEVWNSNDIQDEFMGQVVLSNTNGEVDDQMKLQLSKKDQKATGIVSVRVITSTQLTSM